MIIAIVSATAINSHQEDIERLRLVATSLQELRSYMDKHVADINDSATAKGVYVNVVIHDLQGATFDELYKHQSWLRVRDYDFTICWG